MKISVLTLLALLPACAGNSVSQQPQAQGSSSMKLETLPSGLQYAVLKEASNKTRLPEIGQKVVVHYTGWLEKDGAPTQQFDSSVSRGEPFVFRVGIGQVIKGWDEGVMLMTVGEKRRFIIPAPLAYGTQGISGVIPANATLIFDVELLGIG